ncbi:LPS-assembly protein LptD [Brevirhabdus sp.]|uniref:LPS-assembly protein LptD n=1 Tax=Brevirhabdus sp. TaxID=2004514 RepID=UPI0040598FE8
MAGFRRLICAALFAALAGSAHAQEPAATLVADSISLDGNASVTASGNVEVLYQGTRLRASSVRYSQQDNRLIIEGPLYLVEGGNQVLVADMAALDRDLQNGVIRGARLVLNQQLQIAAVEANRINGRYTQLYKSVASSCQVCVGNPVPLWEIRAKEIIHDQRERQLYFNEAQFRLAGVPIAYLPRLRLPDPTRERSTGLLIPRVRTTNKLGTGLKLPYFIAIGDDKDLTLTPYFTSSGARSLDARYRQAFNFGSIEINGATTHDDLVNGHNRGYLYATGAFDLPRDFKLSFNLERVSDAQYLVDYGLEDQDRLESDIALTRTRRGEHIGLNLIQYESLRSTETNALLPTLVGEATYRRRFSPRFIGGQLDLAVEALSFRRSSDRDVLGRDVSSLRSSLDWRRSWTYGNGIVGAAQALMTADYYNFNQDSTFSSTANRAVVQGAVELRWPMERSIGNVRHVIEPVVQLIAGSDDNVGVPNEDALLVEFDEGNLFALSRFPGKDAYERGLRANVGIGWTRYDPAGWSLGTTVGRVIRANDPSQFTGATGLDGQLSDWLVTTRLDSDRGLSLINRAVFDDNLSFAKNELRLRFSNDFVSLASSYIWLEADIAESRPIDTSEVALEATYEIARNWYATTDVRYDFRADRASQTALGLGYRNECITVDLSVSRRYASISNVAATTDFGFSVALNGFGASRDGRAYRRSCIK